jgi:hypothetical protein
LFTGKKTSMTGGPGAARKRDFTTAIVGTVAIYLAVMGLVTATWIIVDPIEGKHPNLVDVLDGVGFLAAYLVVLAPPILVMLGWWRQRTNLVTWATGVFTGSILGGLLGIVVEYQLFRLLAHAGRFDLGASLTVELIMTILLGLPAGAVATVIAMILNRRRKRQPS